MAAVDVRWVSERGIEPCAPEDARTLLGREGGFVWVDIPEPDEESASYLSDTFGFPPTTVAACRERSIVAKLRPYDDHVFMIVHSPEPGDPGQIRLLELDQFMSERYLVTVHGPLTPGVPIEKALRETKRVIERIEAGRFSPKRPAELSYAIVSAVADRMEELVSDLAVKVWHLERQVLSGEIEDPDGFLDQMFRVRHEFLSLGTMAAGCREVYERLRTLLGRPLPTDVAPFVEDLRDQFDHVGTLCNGEKEFLQEILDFYLSKTTTQMNTAMKRLALITALALPLTAVASIYGMNFILNPVTNVTHLVVVLGLMGAATLGMLTWARRQGWW